MFFKKREKIKPIGEIVRASYDIERHLMTCYYGNGAIRYYFGRDTFWLTYPRRERCSDVLESKLTKIKAEINRTQQDWFLK